MPIAIERWMMLRIVMVAIMSGLVSGCMPVPGLKPSASVPTVSNVSDSAISAERDRLIATFGGEYAAPAPVIDLVREISGRVVAAAISVIP